jgi:MEDS: MEthanogen/methylotroph, DcmR Sensory domain
MTQNLLNYHVDDVIDHINQAEYGVHHLIIYPDLGTLRKIYPNNVRKHLQETNDIVLINPFYETTDSVRLILSQGNSGFDVSKYEREKGLLIIDSEKQYFGQQPDDISFKRNLADYAKKIGKSGLTILGDVGVYHHECKHTDLVDYEMSLPTKFNHASMKGFCLYHQKDFDKFSEEQQQKLIEHHGKAIKII